MPRFSQRSAARLATCDPQLQTLFNAVILDFDCTVLQGVRSQAQQDEYYRTGRSKVQWPHSKHNASPSQAVDVAPWLDGGIPWPQTPGAWTDAEQRHAYIKDLNHFYYFAGYVIDRAAVLGVELRWGGDWDRDHDLRDNRFDDLVHFELIGRWA
jgi:peptidoglycan L-alanyl-D-glutamate endopeptidase CwlK